MGGYIYILTNKKHGVLYVGVTNDLPKKGRQDKGRFYKYGLKLLVYYEGYERMQDAIQREKKLKNRQRNQKINLIDACNKDRRDVLYNAS